MRLTKKAGIFYMAKVTTGTGDTGYTSLLGETRVAKYDPLPDAFGTVDEATSALGIARAQATQERVGTAVLAMQRDLYVLMADLATPPQHRSAVGVQITVEHVQALEKLEEDLKAEVVIPNRFIIPGDTVEGAALDFARTVIRRAERMVAKLVHDGTVSNVETLRYLNRLSDVVFILARYVEATHGGSTEAKVC